MNHLRHSDPAERNALIGCLTATGGQRALASGGKLQQVLRSLGPYRISCTVRLAGEKSAMHAI